MTSSSTLRAAITAGCFVIATGFSAGLAAATPFPLTPVPSTGTDLGTIDQNSTAAPADGVSNRDITGPYPGWQTAGSVGTGSDMSI